MAKGSWHVDYTPVSASQRGKMARAEPQSRTRNVHRDRVQRQPRGSATRKKQEEDEKSVEMRKEKAEDIWGHASRAAPPLCVQGVSGARANSVSVKVQDAWCARYTEKSGHRWHHRPRINQNFRYAVTIVYKICDVPDQTEPRSRQPNKKGGERKVDQMATCADL